MRKRNKEENSWIGNAEYCQDSKRRQKTKSSERFARELQSFEHTLDNVKRLYADSKDRIAQDSLFKKLCYTESFDNVSTPPISTGILSPLQHTLPNFDEVSTPMSTGILSLQQHTLPNFDKVFTPTSTGILSPQQHTLPNFDEVSTPPISTGILSPQQHTLPNFDEVSTPPISTGILSPQQHTLPNFDKVSTPPISTGIICLQQHTLPNFDEVSTPPISTVILFPEEHSLPLSMQQTPADVDSPASKHKSTSENRSDPRENSKHIEGIQEIIVSSCVKGSHEAPSLYIEPPSETYGDLEAMKGRESLSQNIEPPSETYGDLEAMKGRESLSQNMQKEHSCKQPCHEATVVLVSNVFSSFLKRLIKHGLYIDLRNSPGYEKDVLVGHQVKDSKQIGTEEFKEVEPKQQSAITSLPFSKSQEDSEDLREVELEKHFKSSSLLLSKTQEVAKETKVVESEKRLPTSSILFSTSEEVAKESKVVDREEDSPLLLTIHEDNAEELKEAEPKKQVEMSSLLFSTTEDIASDSDNEDDGDLKHLWDDMEFSLACMNESKRDQAGPGNKKTDGCNHNFYKKDDLGLVCSLCGLVGQDTEHIFNYIWGEASKKKRNGKRAAVENPSMTLVEEELSEGLELLPVQETNQALVLHSEYRDRLRAHQEEGIQFLQRNLVQNEPNGCILAHAPGTGKSFLIIAFLQSFQNSFPDERPLIVAPNGMLSVWVREFQKWKVEDIPIFNLYEAPSSQEQDDNDNSVLRQRRQGQLAMLQEWRAKKSVLLVGYPTFSRLISGNDAPLFSGIKKLLLEVPGLLILDEGHFPRNKDTQILKSLSQVQTKRRVLLSGTLFQNNFYELYNLYYLVRPDFMTMNASFTKSLLEEFMKGNPSPAKTKFSASPKGSKQRSRREDMELRLFEYLGDTIKLGDPEKKRQAISQLRQLSEPFVHWYKGQVLEELPGLVDLTLFLKMTCLQQELLSSLQAKVENQLDRAVKSTKVCIHPLLVNMAADATHNNEPSWKDSEVDPKSSAKIMFVLDLLQLAAPLQEKVLLFSQLLDPFYLLEKMLKKLWGWRANKEVLKIEGQTSLEERESVIDRFNRDPKSRILFASIKTCGEGVSLIGASRIVLLDVQWNPMVSRQAISRAFRIGQKRKVFVYRLVGQGSMEEYAHMKASQKEWLAKQIFEGCRDEDYASYCHEVNPLEVDTYFESQYLRENVLKCFRYHFV